jgi:hypothetical protein
MKYPKMTISKPVGTESDVEIGRRYFKVGGTVYSVGDVIKGMKFHVSENEYFEADAKLTSTNVRKKTASFRGVGSMTHKKEK